MDFFATENGGNHGKIFLADGRPIFYNEMNRPGFNGGSSDEQDRY